MSDRYDEGRAETEQTGYDTNPSDQGKWISGLIALAGVWLIVEPFLFDVLLLGNFWNDVVVGASLVVLSGYNFYRRSNEQLGSTAAASLAALLGLWLIVSPFVYEMGIGVADLTNELGFWNDVVVGLIVLVLGAYSAYEARDVDVMSTAAER